MRILGLLCAFNKTLIHRELSHAKLIYPNSEVHVGDGRAVSPCRSMYFLRTSSQSKSRTVPFWVQQTGHPTCLPISQQEWTPRVEC